MQQADTGQFPVPASTGMGWAEVADEPEAPTRGLTRSEVRKIMSAPPKEGYQGKLYAKLGIDLGPGPEETRKREELVDRIRKDRQRDLDNIERISRELVRTQGFAGFINVMSEKGGCGKTTLTSLLAYELDAIRRDRVVVADLNPDRGSLYSKMDVTPTQSLGDLIVSFDDIYGGRDHAMNYLTRVPGTNISVLSGDLSPEQREGTNEQDVIKIFQLLSPLASLVVLDNGTGITHSALSGSLQVSHSMALIMENTLDAEKFIRDTLSFLQKNNHDELRNRLVLVVNDKAAISPDESQKFIDHLVQEFGHQVRSLVVIPFDRSLARSGPINFSEIGIETRKAVRHLAALLIDDMVR